MLVGDGDAATVTVDTAGTGLGFARVWMVRSRMRLVGRSGDICIASCYFAFTEFENCL